MSRTAADIFLEARERPDARRTAYLDGACGKDLALRAKVEALLKADAEAGNFMAGPSPIAAPMGAPAAAPAADPSTEATGTQIGRYKLLEKIGEGGMGTIWMAEQREPVRRRVALKIIKLGMDTKQVIARFEAERQALAMMDHPNIAKVLDAGATEAGRPYFVMEYIKGIPILEYCDQELVDTPGRLELFTYVCHAIQHAHQKGIIHRDIKPSNVLVTLHDGVAVPKVIDFGIAKATNSELTTRTLFTEHRQMIGTPAYMSPEQAEMSGLDIDTRSDVYSLGVLLYELLTGTTPFDMQALLESGLAEMMRTIREVEPHKPSTRVSTLGDSGTRTAQRRRTEVRKLSSLLRGDLDWIVMKCLEKDRTRRYDTANGLAADIARHLKNETVTAGAPSAGYRLRKFVRRNRLQVLAASAVAAALVIALVGTAWGLVEKSRAKSAKFQRELEDQQRSTEAQARRARDAEAVGALLGQCEIALGEGDAAKAKLALDAARTRADEGGADHDPSRLVQHARLARLEADLVLSTELDAIDQFLWTWSGTGFGSPDVGRTRIREALWRFGANPEAESVEDATARVEASAIRGRIVSSMDWLLIRWKSEALCGVVHRVDSDPFRDSFRDALLANDLEEQAALAASPEALEQPAEFAAALGRNEAIPVARRQELLRRALVRWPSNLVLLMTLQGTFPQTKETADERLRWLQAAIAVDPRNSAAYTNVGLALVNKGKGGPGDRVREDEAAACYLMALELDPQNAVACNNLGVLHYDNDRSADALSWLEKAAALDPKFVYSYTNMGRALQKLGRFDEAIDCFRKAIVTDPELAVARRLLGNALRDKGPGHWDEAIACYRKAIELASLDPSVPPEPPDPNLEWSYGQLGDLLLNQGQLDEAIACFRKTVELGPWASNYSRLADALRKQGQLDEAIVHYRKAAELAAELEPKLDYWCGLGVSLRLKGQGGELDEAITCLRKSVEIRPDYSPSWQELSIALYLRNGPGDAEESVSCARKGVALEPTNAEARRTLGAALSVDGKRDEAIACYRKGLALDPKDGIAWHNLALLLVQSARLDEALACHRSAVELKPEIAEFHVDLATLLDQLGQRDAAIESFRDAVALEPKHAFAQYGLGCCLKLKERWEEAIDAFQKAIALDPNHAEAHCNLSNCLMNVGRLPECLEHIRRGHELGSKRPDWPYPSAEWLRIAESRIALDAKLPALLEGKEKPKDNAELHEYVGLCASKKLYGAAARLTVDLFAADPRLADDVDTKLRYNAALCAAQASAGECADAAQLDDAARARLRKQAIDWLLADLDLLTRKMESGNPEDRAAVQATLREWQAAPELACLRDPEALALLPAEDETDLELLWADVAELLRD